MARWTRKLLCSHRILLATVLFSLVLFTGAAFIPADFYFSWDSVGLDKISRERTTGVFLVQTKLSRSDYKFFLQRIEEAIFTELAVSVSV